MHSVNSDSLVLLGKPSFTFRLARAWVSQRPAVLAICCLLWVRATSEETAFFLYLKLNS